MNPRLIVFDWDGTLMDSIGTIVGCAQQSLVDIGRTDIPDETIRAGVGLGLDVGVKLLLPDGDEELWSRWVERYRHNWLSDFYNRSSLLPGARQAIEDVAAAGYWLAIATGKGRAGLDRDLEVANLTSFFLATRTSNDAPSKPHPQMLLDILQELGVAAEEAVVVGDTTFDLDMAKNAGCPSVGVLSGSHSREQLTASGPLTCLPSARELPAWLAKRAP